jgi:ssDNA-binding Zn-finger/Zn-ribbon topoisomerase 1
MGRKNKKKQKVRIRCPKCSGKRITLLNKTKSIWECLNKQCGQKFLYFPDLNRFMTLTGEDFAVISKEETSIPIEGKLSMPDDDESKVEDKTEVLKLVPSEPTLDVEDSPKGDIDDMLKNFGF